MPDLSQIGPLAISALLAYQAFLLMRVVQRLTALTADLKTIMCHAQERTP